MTDISYKVDSDGVAIVTWDLENRSMNVLNAQSVNEYRDIVEKLVKDDQVKGIIIASAKEAFIAGADLTSNDTFNFDKIGEDKVAAAQTIYDGVMNLNKLFRAMETSGKPFVAAINGHALGGGLEICLACHYRVAIDNDRIQIGQPEAKIGLIPGAGGTQRVPRLAGVTQDVMGFLLAGNPVTPKKAMSMGLINEIVEKDMLIEASKKYILDNGKAVQPWDEKGFRLPSGAPYTPKGMMIWAAASSSLRKMSYGNYPAQKAILSALYEGVQVPIDAGLRIEARQMTKVIMDPVSRNMVRSLFVNMQALNKGARRPKDFEKYNVKKVGILGAGLMGAGIAYVTAKAGIEVILIDQNQEGADKGKDYSIKLLDKALSRKKTTEEKKEKLLSLITPTTDYAKLNGADLIIEAVFENRDIKADVTAKAESQISETAVFGSNTSTLPITGLAKNSSRPANFIGVHYFSPVEKMPLVEIIMGKETSQETLAKTMDYVQKIKKTAIVVNDSRGFFTSRVFGTYTGEGMEMLAEGINPALIENAGKMTGMPMAPLALMDAVALDLAYKVGVQTKKDYEAEGKEFPISEPQKVLEEFVEKQGRLGKKNNKGFYEYPENGKKFLWPELFKLYDQIEDQPDVEILKQRLLYIQALETAKCYEENVLTDVRDADIGAILGWGMAPWTGGPLSFIDMVGIKEFVAEADKLAQKYGDRFTPCKMLRDMAEKNESFHSNSNKAA
ncbi:3-hydroxyacyl-CoA dehydrogenase NAD-binding domain-containing protein [Pelagibacteraceae bacterium]|nr:3-hydroxyacyl-CoA dehydrogenase NAD-binding domain-containing protein [Pelagibacteraceae bacterium]